MPADDSPAAPTLLERLLRPFSKVRPGEGLGAVLMTACVFLILSGYYLMKTAREGLILTSGIFGIRGDELKAYAGGAMAVLLVGLVPAYDALASRVPRIRLITVSYAIVIGCLALFFVLDQAGVPIGLAFFIWIGLVNMFLIAQFWSYANDLYNEEQGKRLFAIIAIGGSVGGLVGPKLADLAHTDTLLLFAAAMLVGCLALFHTIERVQPKSAREVASEPISGSGGFALVMRDRYLLLIAALVFVGAFVKTTGEFVLSNAAADRAAEVFPAAAYAALSGAARELAMNGDRREYIKAFYGDFFFWVNVVGFVIQAFVVSRVIEKLGVRRALFVLPVIALGAYAAIGLVGGLALVRIAKIAENGTDYSLQNTVRQTLFLPTDRAVKYKAKAAIDTFVVRAGDTLSALFIGFGIHELGFGSPGLVLINIVLIGIWFAIVIGIARLHRRLVPAPPLPVAVPTGPTPALVPAR